MPSITHMGANTNWSQICWVKFSALAGDSLVKVTEIYFSSAGFSSRWPRIAFRIMVFLPINTTTKYIRQTVTLTCHNCSVNFQNSMNFLQTINYLLSFGTVNTQCYAKHNMLHTAILHDLSCLHTTQCKNSQKRQDYTFLTKYYPHQFSFLTTNVQIKCVTFDMATEYTWDAKNMECHAASLQQLSCLFVTTCICECLLVCWKRCVLTVSNEITKTNLHCQNVKWTTFIESCCFLSCYLQILAGQCEFFASAWSQHCLQRQWSTLDIQPEVAVQKMYTTVTWLIDTATLRYVFSHIFVF